MTKRQVLLLNKYLKDVDEHICALTKINNKYADKVEELSAEVYELRNEVINLRNDYKIQNSCLKNLFGEFNLNVTAMKLSHHSIIDFFEERVDTIEKSIKKVNKNATSNSK